MRHPTLRQVEDDLARIEGLAPKLGEAARWAWPMAYDRIRRGEVVREADVARPVEAAVGTQGTPEWEVRHEVGRAGLLIARAAEDLVLAAGALARVQAVAESVPVPVSADRSSGPPLVSKAELAAARKAKARRDASRPRGVGYGEY